MNGVKKYFNIEERGSSIKTELVSGLIVFMAMFYIIPVQGGMMGASLGIDPIVGAATIGIVTALAAGIATIAMGLYAKHPLALASGMGVNAFVSYTLIAAGMSFSAAMAAVMLSGLLFIIISVTPARIKILNAVPDDLKKAISIGVGFFLLLVALTHSGIIG